MEPRIFTDENWNDGLVEEDYDRPDLDGSFLMRSVVSFISSDF